MKGGFMVFGILECAKCGSDVLVNREFHNKQVRSGSLFVCGACKLFFVQKQNKGVNE